jgi:hypothetical protein
MRDDEKVMLCQTLTWIAFGRTDISIDNPLWRYLGRTDRVPHSLTIFCWHPDMERLLQKLAAP